MVLEHQSSHWVWVHQEEASYSSGEVLVSSGNEKATAIALSSHQPRSATPRPMDPTGTDRANASSKCLLTTLIPNLRRKSQQVTLPATFPLTSTERREHTLGQRDGESEETYLYLAYGSNLADKTFLGDRGIKPISSINVQVPDLRLTFDLPGVPYAEPCFANTGRREFVKSEKQEQDEPLELNKGHNRSSPKHPPYRKDQWKKGLVGTVYEVTPSDYAHIIATEGGGSSYHDILVDCYPFSSTEISEPVPEVPRTKAFKAHTLFAPAADKDEPPPKDGGRFQRPDTSYAQASARYLGLLTDGAQERGIPQEYQDFLRSLQPYTITSRKQQLGQFIFTSLWMPIILFVFGLSRMFSDKDGKAPSWLRLLTAAMFRGIWLTYDGLFKDTFGDGERTQEDGDDEKAIASTFGGNGYGDMASSVLSLEDEKLLMARLPN